MPVFCSVIAEIFADKLNESSAIVLIHTIIFEMTASRSLEFYRSHGIRIGILPAYRGGSASCALDRISQGPTDLETIQKSCGNKLGHLFELTTLCLEVLRIPFNRAMFLAVEGDNYGSRINGTWKGQLVNVSRDEIDTTFPVLTPTNLRSEIVDFTDAVVSVSVGFLTRFAYIPKYKIEGDRIAFYGFTY